MLQVASDYVEQTYGASRGISRHSESCGLPVGSVGIPCALLSCSCVEGSFKTNLRQQVSHWLTFNPNPLVPPDRLAMINRGPR